MDSQIFFITQKAEHCVRDSPDAKLQRIAVPDQAGTVGPDSQFHIPNHRGLQRKKRRVMFDNSRYVVDMDCASEGDRHLWIYLDNHGFCGFRSLQRIIYGDAEAEVTVLIGRSRLD